MILNEDEWCQAMFGSDSHKTFKQYLFECYKSGDSVKSIAKTIGKSISTVYKYIQVEMDKIRYPILKAEMKIALNQGNLKYLIEILNYKDICIIKRNFKLSGTNKESKIQAILDYFKDFSILKIFPEELTKLKIKIAFRKRAKETHPDLNKKVGKCGKDFQEVHRVYTNLVKIYA